MFAVRPADPEVFDRCFAEGLMAAQAGAGRISCKYTGYEMWAWHDGYESLEVKIVLPTPAKK